MDEAERRTLLAQPALEAPDGVEPHFANPPNMNALAVLARIHFWIFVLKQPRGRLEAVLVVGGFTLYIGLAYCLLRIARLEIGWWVHQWDVTLGATIGFSYWVYIAGLLYKPGIALIKVAIVMEWLRIFSPHSRHAAFFWICQISLWLNVMYYIAAIVVESIRCTPRGLIWDPTVKGTCLDTKAIEVISSINVVSDASMLVAPVLVIRRLKLSAAKGAGVALMFVVGLFGTVSAILQLFATQEYLKSADSTYSVAPVRFWEFSEMTSIFIVYGLPAIPTAFSGASTGFSHCHAQWAKWAQACDPNAGNSGPWREGRAGPNMRYKNLDRSSLPITTRDTAPTRCVSIIDPDPPRPPESISVVKTVEIRRDSIRTDALDDGDKDVEEDVLLRQHPWVKLG